MHVFAEDKVIFEIWNGLTQEVFALQIRVHIAFQMYFWDFQTNNKVEVYTHKWKGRHNAWYENKLLGKRKWVISCLYIQERNWDNQNTLNNGCFVVRG